MAKKQRTTGRRTRRASGTHEEHGAAHEGSFGPLAGSGSLGPVAWGPQHSFPENRAKKGLGWLRDMPDFRDTTLEGKQQRLQLSKYKDAKSLHARVAKAIGKRLTAKSTPPGKWDKNEPFCSTVEDQRNLGSCTANAGAGMVEYMENRASGKYVDASRLFLYKVTRNLLGWTGDTGAYLRTTMKALVLFGSPPERWWPYDDLSTFDDEPDAFLYAFASNYKAIQYMRLDSAGLAGKKVLNNVKAAIATNYVSMFGFPVYSSLSGDADIPYPTPTDSLDGGHAILAVGYDDNHRCPNAAKGALRIRNSWGLDWGDGGYGWLPYDYVLDGLATDFWTCFKLEWVDTRQFE